MEMEKFCSSAQKYALCGKLWSLLIVNALIGTAAACLKRLCILSTDFIRLLDLLGYLYGASDHR